MAESSAKRFVSGVRLAAFYFSVQNMQLSGCVPTEAEVQNSAEEMWIYKEFGCAFDADNMLRHCLWC